MVVVPFFGGAELMQTIDNLESGKVRKGAAAAAATSSSISTFFAAALSTHRSLFLPSSQTIALPTAQHDNGVKGPFSSSLLSPPWRIGRGSDLISGRI